MFLLQNIPLSSISLSSVTSYSLPRLIGTRSGRADTLTSSERHGVALGMCNKVCCDLLLECGSLTVAVVELAQRLLWRHPVRSQRWIINKRSGTGAAFWPLGLDKSNHMAFKSSASGPSPPPPSPVPPGYCLYQHPHVHVHGAVLHAHICRPPPEIANLNPMVESYPYRRMFRSNVPACLRPKSRAKPP